MHAGCPIIAFWPLVFAEATEFIHVGLVNDLEYRGIIIPSMV
jgi:hypothetical protein